MSTRLPVAPSLGLLIASLTQTLQQALALRGACFVRALGAPRACVWHARAPEPPRPAPHSLRSMTDRSQHAVSPSTPNEPYSSRHVSGRPAASRHCRPPAPALASAAQTTSAR